MKIKTLESIHQLLIEKEQQRRHEYSKAIKLGHRYEEAEEPDKELIKSQMKAVKKFMAIHLEAVNALDDFETHEWR